MNHRISQGMTTLLLLAGSAMPPGLMASERDKVQVPEETQTQSKAGAMTGFLETVNKRALEVAASRKIRLAVIPITGTESPRHADKGFGAYLTEKTSTSLGSANSPIRLFERTRLDAVLDEQALSASGIFDESEARKIGELAPIDYILTGTFTRLDRSIAVNLRLRQAGQTGGCRRRHSLRATLRRHPLQRDFPAHPLQAVPAPLQPVPAADARESRCG